MEILEVLDNLNIKYEKVEHPAVYTVEEMKQYQINMDGDGCKNLFLKDKKSNFYILVLPEDKRADTKGLAKLLGTPYLSFANEDYLKDILDLERGSVTPFGIINDKDNKVKVLIDTELKGKKLLFHPNRNTATVSIEYNDLIKFIEHEKHSYKLV